VAALILMVGLLSPIRVGEFKRKIRAFEKRLAEARTVGSIDTSGLVWRPRNGGRAPLRSGRRATWA
jgi:hypothetical protein